MCISVCFYENLSFYTLEFDIAVLFSFRRECWFLVWWQSERECESELPQVKVFFFFPSGYEIWISFEKFGWIGFYLGIWVALSFDFIFWFVLVSQFTKNFWEYLDSINFVFDFVLVLGYLQLALDNQGLEAKSPRTVERESVSHRV